MARIDEGPRFIRFGLRDKRFPQSPGPGPDGTFDMGGAPRKQREVGTDNVSSFGSAPKTPGRDCREGSLPLGLIGPQSVTSMVHELNGREGAKTRRPRPSSQSRGATRVTPLLVA